MFIYTPEEIEALKNKITVSYHNSDLPGAKICHGTTASQIPSILEGPKNLHEGLGGAGLNVAFANDDHMAREYAVPSTWRNDQHLAEKQRGVILEGHLNPEKNFRVARITLNKHLTSIDIENGTFPLHWNREPSIRKFINDNFDMVEVIGAKNLGKTITPERFLVIHQSAGADAVLWNGYRPILSPERITMNYQDSISIHIRPQPIQILPLTVNEYFQGGAARLLRQAQSPLQRNLGILPANWSNVLDAEQLELAAAYEKHFNKITWRTNYSPIARFPINSGNLVSFSTPPSITYHASRETFTSLSTGTVQRTSLPRVIQSPGVSEEVRTIPWRPAFTEGRRVPWYRCLDPHAAVYLIKTPLLLWSYQHQLHEERSHYPTLSELAHHSATVASLAFDTWTFTQIMHATTLGCALPLSASLHLLTEIANGIRHVPAESMRDNRDFLMTAIHGWELSPQLERFLLEDFDRGGILSRNFNQNSALVTKTFFKPFEWLHDIRSGIAYLGRVFGQSLSNDIIFKFLKQGPEIALSEFSVRTANLFRPTITTIPAAAGFSFNVDSPLSLYSSRRDFWPEFSYNPQQNIVAPYGGFYGETNYYFNVDPHHFPSLNHSRSHKNSQNSFNTPQFTQANTEAIPQTKKPVVTSPSTPMTDTPEQNSSHDGTSLLEKRLSLFFEQMNVGATLPLQPSPFQPLPPMGLTQPHISMMECTPSGWSFHMTPSSTSLNPELHQFLLEINKDIVATTQANTNIKTIDINLTQAVVDTSISHTTSVADTHTASSKEKAGSDKPFITDIRLAEVAGSIGIAVTLYNQGIISFTASKTGFFVSSTSAFGAEFWSGLATATGCGAVIAGAVMAVQYFYRRHLKHIQHKITADIKHTRHDGEFISSALSNLSKHLHTEIFNIPQLLQETNGLISHIYSKIEKEKTRAHYAKEHDNRDARNAHRDVVKNYKQTLFDLFQLEQSLRHDQLRKQFIQEHQDKNPTEIIKLIESSLPTWSKLPGNNEKQDLYDRIDQLYAAGYRLYKHWDGHNHGGHMSAAEAKQYVTQENATLEAKKSGDKKWLGLPAGYMQAEQEFAKIVGAQQLLFVVFEDLIKTQQISEAIQVQKTLAAWNDSPHKVPSLQLADVSQFFGEVLGDLNQPTAFWVSRLNQLDSNPASYPAEKLSVLKTAGIHKVSSALITHIFHEDFSEATQLIHDIPADLRGSFQPFISTIAELKAHQHDVHYSLQTLQRSKDSSATEKTLIDQIVESYHHQKVKQQIITLVIADKFAEAKTIKDIYATVSPERAKQYQEGLEKLQTLKDKKTHELLAELKLVNQQHPDSTDNEGVDICRCVIRCWSHDKILQSIAIGNTDEAKKNLQTFKETDPTQAVVCDLISNRITQHEQQHGSKRDETYWHQQYQEWLNKQPPLDPTNPDGNRPKTEEEAHAAIENQAAQLLLMGEFLTIATGHSKLGFNRKAAEVIKGLRARDPSLKLNELEEDFNFAHQGQLANIFARPILMVAHRFVQGVEQPTMRWVLNGGLEVVNVTQIVLPNFVSLGIQRVYSKCAGEMCVFNRNWENIKLQLWNDLANPLNTENYCNGALMLGQLVIKGVEYFPVDWLVSNKNLLWYENKRNAVVAYSDLGMQGVFSGITFHQLKNAWYVEEGLFSVASTPLLLTQIGSLISDLGFWGYRSYKAQQGLAIESLDHYRLQGKVNSVWNSIGAAAFAWLITGGWGWPLLAGLGIGGASVYNLTGDSTTKKNADKVLQAALNNLQYYRQRQYVNEYIEKSTYHLLTREPNPQEISTAKLTGEIIIIKNKNNVIFYSLDFETGDYKQRKLHDPHGWAVNLLWPNDPTTSTQIANHALKIAQNLIRLNLLSTPVVEYTANCQYRLTKAVPSQALVTQIVAGKVIVLSQEVKNGTHSYYFYFKNRDDNTLGQKEIIPEQNILKNFQPLANQDEMNISPTDGDFHDLMCFATSFILQTYRWNSLYTIVTHLENVFGGLAYVAEVTNQAQANEARIIHLTNHLQDELDNEKYDAVIADSQLIHSKANNEYVINNIYQIPPHLAWDIIELGLRALFVCPNRMVDFPDEYEKYITQMVTSAKKSPAWYDRYWLHLQERFQHIVKYALEQFIIAASSREIATDEQMKYLDLVTRHYSECKDWFHLLSAESKLHVAILYYQLGQIKKSAIFVERISDLEKLLLQQKNGAINNAVFQVIVVGGIEQQNSWLSRMMSGQGVDDETFLSSAFQLLDKGKHQQAYQFTRNSRNFRGKCTVLAFCQFRLSKESDVFGSLNQLMKEKEEEITVYYWKLFSEIILKLIDSIKYSPKPDQNSRSTATLYGLLAVAATKIQVFDLPHTTKYYFVDLLKTARKFLSEYVRANILSSANLSPDDVEKKVEELIQYGLQCMRGESGLSVRITVEEIVRSMSYRLKEEDTINPYLPIEVPADGNGVFHAMGITRKEGIDQLLQHVNNQRWRGVGSLLRQIKELLVGKQPSKDVVNILLDDLESQKPGTQFTRNGFHYAENVQAIRDYLETLKKDGTWMLAHEGGQSVLDALALLLHINLRIFVHDKHGELRRFNRHTDDPSLKNLDLLATSAKGCNDSSGINHYVKLVEIPPENNVDAQPTVHNSLPALFLNSILHTHLTTLNKTADSGNNKSKVTSSKANQQEGFKQKSENNVVKMNIPCKQSHNNDTMAHGDGIFNTLNEKFGDAVEIFNPNLATNKSLFDPAPTNACEAAAIYAERISGYTFNNNGAKMSSAGILDSDKNRELQKPIIAIVNTSHTGVHWVAIIILPKNYKGKDNARERIYFIDSLNPNREFPLALREFLVKGGVYQFEAPTNENNTTLKIVEHHIKPAFPHAQFMQLRGFRIQQLGGTDCGWWAVDNAIRIVETGSAATLINPPSPRRATDLRGLYPSLDKEDFQNQPTTVLPGKNTNAMMLGKSLSTITQQNKFQEAVSTSPNVKLGKNK